MSVNELDKLDELGELAGLTMYPSLTTASKYGKAVLVELGSKDGGW